MSEPENYKVEVNEHHEFEISAADLAKIDLLEVGKSGYHILQNNKSYNIEITSFDLEKKSIAVSVNGTTYQVDIKDHYDQLVNKLGLSAAASLVEKDIKAPMPGLVLDVSVKIGDNVEIGDGLLILEAMKMENVIKSSGSGIVRSIHIDKGNTVEKGQLLIEME